MELSRSSVGVIGPLASVQIYWSEDSMRFYLKNLARQRTVSLALVALTEVWVACGQKTPQEDTTCGQSVLKIDSFVTSMQLVNANETKEHPAVVLILQKMKNNQVSACTGTFISSSSLITAAHCVGASANGDMFYVPGEKPNFASKETKAIQALRVFHLGKTSADFIEMGAENPALDDLAILTFPEGTAPAAMGFTSARPQPEQEVTLVGYGSTQIVGSQDVSNYLVARRLGNNKVKATPNALGFSVFQILIGFVTEKQSIDAKGGLAIPSSGDSGGPLIYNGLIAGIASTSAVIQSNPIQLFSAYNSVNETQTAQLLAAARASGAKVPEIGEVVTLKNPAPAVPSKNPGADEKTTTKVCTTTSGFQ